LSAQKNEIFPAIPVWWSQKHSPPKHRWLTLKKQESAGVPTRIVACFGTSGFKNLFYDAWTTGVCDLITLDDSLAAIVVKRRQVVHRLVLKPQTSPIRSTAALRR
jgi:hypothetical protein